MGAIKPPIPHKAQGGVTPFAGGACLRGAGPGMRAQTSARRSDQHRETTGGVRRRTSLWETFCSACSPGVRGRQYRVRGDVRARLLGELEASVDQTACDPTPASETIDYHNSTPFSSYRVPHKRHK